MTLAAVCPKVAALLLLIMIYVIVAPINCGFLCLFLILLCIPKLISSFAISLQREREREMIDLL